MLDYPISKLSYSSLRTFMTSPGVWKNRYILGEKRGLYTPAMVVGELAHMALEMFFKGHELSDAMNEAHTYLSTIQDSEINFGKEGSREKIIKDFTQAVKHFFAEMPKYKEIIDVEVSLEGIAQDVIDGKEIISPLPFCGRIDLLTKDKKFIPEDYKFVTSYTEEDNPAYIFQAYFYYYLLKANGFDCPYMIFREVKISKNKDGSSQINTIKIMFSGDTFEEGKAYFWYNVLAMQQMIKSADQDTIFLYNIFDRISGKDAWRMMKESILGYQVKNESSQDFSMIEERRQRVERFIEEDNKKTIEEKIIAKCVDFGVALKFESMQEGYAYNRYLFSPSRGVKMAKIASLKDEIRQVLALESVRIEAPVRGTTFIGVEVPRKERNYLPLKNVKKGKIPLGKDIAGTEHFVDLKDPNTPHLLVVGKTGSGKSEFLKIVCKAMADEELILIDPKRTELAEFSNGRNHFYEDSQIEAVLCGVEARMMNTYAELSSVGKKDVSSIPGFKRTIIVFEEYANVRLGMYGKEIEQRLLKICALGRASGIHLILSTQRPDVKVVTGSLKANIGARVCFAVATGIDSNVAIDELGAENLTGKGDMLYKNPGETTKRLQSYYIDRG